MKVLITGDKGFVGTETTKVLLEAGHEVIGYDIMDGFDIRDAEQLEDVFRAEEPERVLHLAAIARFSDADRDPVLAYETNVKGTSNVAGACDEYHIPLVYASTGSCYMPLDISKIDETDGITEQYPIKGNSVYGCSKSVGELVVRRHTPHIVLRYAHLYGAEKRMHGLIGGYLDRIKFGAKPQLFGGGQSNDFAYIKDIARLNMLALTAPWDKWNQVYNAGTGEELTAEQAGQIVMDTLGYTGGVDKHDARTVDAVRFVYNMNKTKTMLGFIPEYDFKAGMADLIKEAGL